MTDNSIILFLAVFFIANYACAAFFISKTPDPCTEFGMSLNAFVAAGIAGIATAAAFVIVLISGVVGCFISFILLSPIVYIVTKKMSKKEKPRTV
ncbi:MAG: hypothetical protein PHW24_02940 [Candidatus Moranbacteria bacterium]|nr:hypothetical protein [Candidatus Moranbacteria bacterium]